MMPQHEERSVKRAAVEARLQPVFDVLGPPPDKQRPRPSQDPR